MDRILGVLGRTAKYVGIQSTLLVGSWTPHREFLEYLTDGGIDTDKLKTKLSGLLKDQKGIDLYCKDITWEGGTLSILLGKIPEGDDTEIEVSVAELTWQRSNESKGGDTMEEIATGWAQSLCSISFNLTVTVRRDNQTLLHLTTPGTTKDDTLESMTCELKDLSVSCKGAPAFSIQNVFCSVSKNPTVEANVISATVSPAAVNTIFEVVRIILPDSCLNPLPLSDSDVVLGLTVEKLRADKMQRFTATNAKITLTSNGESHTVLDSPGELTVDVCKKEVTAKGKKSSTQLVAGISSSSHVSVVLPSEMLRRVAISATDALIAQSYKVLSLAACCMMGGWEVKKEIGFDREEVYNTYTSAEDEASLSSDDEPETVVQVKSCLNSAVRGSSQNFHSCLSLQDCSNGSQFQSLRSSRRVTVISPRSIKKQYLPPSISLSPGSNAPILDLSLPSVTFTVVSSQDEVTLKLHSVSVKSFTYITELFCETSTVVLPRNANHTLMKITECSFKQSESGHQELNINNVTANLSNPGLVWATRVFFEQVLQDLAAVERAVTLYTKVSKPPPKEKSFSHRIKKIKVKTPSNCGLSWRMEEFKASIGGLCVENITIKDMETNTDLVKATYAEAAKLDGYSVSLNELRVKETLDLKLLKLIPVVKTIIAVNYKNEFTPCETTTTTTSKEPSQPTPITINLPNNEISVEDLRIDVPSFKGELTADGDIEFKIDSVSMAGMAETFYNAVEKSQKSIDTSLLLPEDHPNAFPTMSDTVEPNGPADIFKKLIFECNAVSLRLDNAVDSETVPDAVLLVPKVRVEWLESFRGEASISFQDFSLQGEGPSVTRNYVGAYSETEAGFYINFTKKSGNRWKVGIVTPKMYVHKDAFYVVKKIQSEVLSRISSDDAVDVRPAPSVRGDELLVYLKFDPIVFWYVLLGEPDSTMQVSVPFVIRMPGALRKFVPVTDLFWPLLGAVIYGLATTWLSNCVKKVIGQEPTTKKEFLKLATTVVQGKE